MGVRRCRRSWFCCVRGVWFAVVRAGVGREPLLRGMPAHRVFLPPHRVPPRRVFVPRLCGALCGCGHKCLCSRPPVIGCEVAEAAPLRKSTRRLACSVLCT